MRASRSEFRQPVSEDSDDSDAVFSEQNSRRTPRRCSSFHQPKQRKYRSLSFTDREWRGEEERGERDEGYHGNSHRDKRRPWVWDGEMELREECEDQEPEVRARRCSRSESVRSSRSRTWSHRDNPDKHVRFQENAGERGSGVWEMLGHVLMERGVPVKFGTNGAPLRIQLHRRESQAFQGGEATARGHAQPRPSAFQRAAAARHSFHGDVRERRRLSHQENGGRDQREERERQHNIGQPDGEVYELSRRERGGSRRWRERRRPDDEEERERSSDHPRVEHRRWHRTTEERLSSEEEQEAQQRSEQPRRRAPQRSQSLSSSRASARHRSLYMAAGNQAGLQPTAQGVCPKSRSLPPSLSVCICFPHLPSVVA